MAGDAFIPSRKFRRKYDKIFKRDPAAANVMLLLAELANERGQVSFDGDPAAEIARLMEIRFENPRAYQLPGGPKQ